MIVKLKALPKNAGDECPAGYSWEYPVPEDYLPSWHGGLGGAISTGWDAVRELCDMVQPWWGEQRVSWERWPHIDVHCWHGPPSGVAVRMGAGRKCCIAHHRTCNWDCVRREADTCGCTGWEKHNDFCCETWPAEPGRCCLVCYMQPLCGETSLHQERPPIWRGEGWILPGRLTWDVVRSRLGAPDDRCDGALRWRVSEYVASVIYGALPDGWHLGQLVEPEDRPHLPAWRWLYLHDAARSQP